MVNFDAYLNVVCKAQINLHLVNISFRWSWKWSWSWCCFQLPVAFTTLLRSHGSFTQFGSIDVLNFDVQVHGIEGENILVLQISSHHVYTHPSRGVTTLIHTWPLLETTTALFVTFRWLTETSVIFDGISVCFHIIARTQMWIGHFGHVYTLAMTIPKPTTPCVFTFFVFLLWIIILGIF